MYQVQWLVGLIYCDLNMKHNEGWRGKKKDTVHVESTFQFKGFHCERKTTASPPTCQGALSLWQVEDLMKSSSLGTVSSPFLVATDAQRSCGTDTSLACQCRNLGGGQNGGKISQEKIKPEPRVENTTSPDQVCPELFDRLARITFTLLKCVSNHTTNMSK